MEKYIIHYLLTDGSLEAIACDNFPDLTRELTYLHEKFLGDKSTIKIITIEY